MYPQTRQQIMKSFEKVAQEFKGDLRFKVLKNIEDPDEQLEGLHSLRALVRKTMA